MTLEEIIMQTLREYQFGDTLRNGNYVTGVRKYEFANVAKAIVRKFNTQQKPLKNDGDSKQK